MKPAGNAKYLLCDDCNKTLDIRQVLNLCPHCGGLLETVYDLAALKEKSYVFSDNRPGSMWQYKDFMPAVSDENIVTLGEGGTPLIRSMHLGPKLGISKLYFKNDTMMPTGSFKDRGYSLALSYAKEIGVKRGLTYSSGNAGASFAAYSARANFPSLVLVEYQASSIKKAMINLYGTTSAELHFNNFDEISMMLDRAVNELGCYMFVNFINPIRHEAMKTYAYEIYSELQVVPDFSFHPMGTGGGVYGTLKGYEELAQIGVTDKIPRMVAVQPSEVCWLKQAIDSGTVEGKMYGDSTKTIAQSISGNSPLHGGRRLIRAINRSNGLAMGVSDQEIMEAVLDLGREGIAAEPSAAAGVAAFKQAVMSGEIKSDDVVVCVITGTALKQPTSIEKLCSKSQLRLNANLDELKSILGGVEGDMKESLS